MPTRGVQSLAHKVNPNRLFLGTWSQQHNRTLDEGDITASYSADIIGLKGRVRKPFTFNGDLWVTVNITSVRPTKLYAHAYRLMDADLFGGKPVSYNYKARFHDAAVRDVGKNNNGLYHSIAVKYRGRNHVLVGPPMYFYPGNSPSSDAHGDHQLELFGG